MTTSPTPESAAPVPGPDDTTPPAPTPGLVMAVVERAGRPLTGVAAHFGAEGGTIGRADHNRLVLVDAERTVSRVHARLSIADRQWSLHNEGSNGLRINGRLLTYYGLFVATLVLVLAMLRIVNSPFGRVLQAIRENEFRAEAIGYRVVVYRTLSSVLSALFACVAGAMLALWLRYNGPDTSLSFEIMMDVLLIVVIGGMGTMYGAVIGSVLFVVAQSYLQDLLRLGSEAASGLPWLAALLSPDRWLLWLGLLFVLSVYYFPTGVVGRLRHGAALRALKSGRA